MQVEKIEMIIQDSNNGTIHDISDIIGNLAFNYPMEDSAGKCTFTVNLSDVELSISEGSTVSLKVDGEGRFFGFVFKVTEQDEYTNEVTCYDQLKYLTYKDSYVFGAVTCEFMLNRIAKDFGLRVGYIEKSNYNLPPYIHDNASLGDILQKGYDTLLANVGKWFIIRDEFGYIAQRDINKLKTNIVVGDKSLVSTYNYSRDIETNVYNQIKLVQDNSKTGKRDVYIERDSNNIRRWGTLQLYEKVDGNLNPSQIISQARGKLTLYNRVNRTLKLECQGMINLRGGDGIALDLTGTWGTKIQQFAIIKNATHKIDNMVATTTLEVILQ